MTDSDDDGDGDDDDDDDVECMWSYGRWSTPRRSTICSTTKFDSVTHLWGSSLNNDHQWPTEDADDEDDVIVTTDAEHDDDETVRETIEEGQVSVQLCQSQYWKFNIEKRRQQGEGETK